ncbi:testis-expressed protein 26 [Brachyistius frenatus]|uniref:testis-expressed protein 26 n=1 Tax=Brachyistius frenatus TaxID=100188 RepID=UPI0037E7F197
MAAKVEDKQWWDPYETSHRKHFVCRPNSATQILLCPMSSSFIDSYSRSRPFGSTVYNKDFRWKPVCKPECIRTGTASGQRRNNPHPSQSFMTWRLPRDAAQSSECVVLPWKCPPSEEEMRKARTAQYHSTYRCDFLGMPQGYDDIYKAEGQLAPMHNRRHETLSTDTEMRDNYRRPKQNPALPGTPSHYSCNTDPNMACCGIVPTVVQRHIRSQQEGSDLTTYDRFYGKRVSNVTSILKSLLPRELQQLRRVLPEDEKEALRTVLSKDARPNNREKMNKLPAVVHGSCTPEWITNWPGPL